MPEPIEPTGPEGTDARPTAAPGQGMDADVAVSADAGTVSGLGPQEALDDIEADEESGSGD